MYFCTLPCAHIVVLCCVFSKQRHNMLWRSPSASNLSKRLTQMSIDDEPNTLDPLDLDMSMHDLAQCRPRSWSPTDGTGALLLKAQHMGESWPIMPPINVHV